MDAGLTAGIRRGQETQSYLELQKRSVTVEDFAAIGTDSALADDVFAAILKHRMFTPSAEQIRRILEINEAVWKNLAITEQAIAALGDPPVCPSCDEQHLYCVGLFNETGDAVKTLELNWQACVHVHTPKGTWKWDGLVFTPQGVRQRKGAKPRPVGLRWQVCELGRRFYRQAVVNVRPQLDQSQIMGMGQELPFLAALHPRWAVSMNGEDKPFVDAPDLEVAPDGRGKFSVAPYLNFVSDFRQVYLYAGGVRRPYGHYGSGFLQ